MHVSGIKQLEAKAQIENLVEKDATEKLLAELALDSKKRTGDISKHSYGKLKDKRKNKERRQLKDSRGDLHVSSHNTVSKASSTPPEIDEQPSDSDAETGVVLHQQEGEARRRKMELEIEENKLQETLEYQRRIEDDAKQRHLAEQHKSSSRMTPTGNPVDDELKPSRLESIKQNNGARSPPEDRLCNAKDGVLERTEEDEEIEMLVENYLHRCESCHNQAVRLLDSAREMEFQVYFSDNLKP